MQILDMLDVTVLREIPPFWICKFFQSFGRVVPLGLAGYIKLKGACGPMKGHISRQHSLVKLVKSVRFQKYYEKIQRPH